MEYPPPRSEIVVVGGKRKAKCLWEGCGKTVGSSPSDFVAHWRVHTGEKPFVCDWPGCDYSCNQLSAMKVHKRMHTGEKPFVCDWPGCKYACTTSGTLVVHKRMHTGDKPFVCDWPGCDRSFSQNNHLLMHKRTHTGEKPYVCDWEGCNYACIQVSDMKTHKRKHTGEKPYVCDWEGCNYACSQVSAMKTHKRTHTGEKPYVCDWPGCDKAFAESGTLVIHKRRHTGEKPYVCDWPGCDKSFPDSGALAAHKRTHTGEKPHVCNWPGCNKSFSDVGNMVKHKRAHTGERPFVCDWPGCNYSAAHQSSLDTHKRTHTGEKPYKCDVPGCDYAGGTVMHHLHGHIMRHHNATYVARKKEQEERVRKALLDNGWKEWFHPELLPPAGHFKREHQIDFECAAASADRQFCRIDFILGYDGPSYVFLEVDEHQHRFGYCQADGAAISCDAKRMASVHTSLAVEFGKLDRDVPPIYWLRYNPHEWHVDGATTRLPKADRETRLVAFLDKYEAVAPLRIGYAFYDYSDADGLDVLLADEFPAPFRDDGIVDNLRDFTAGERELVCLPC